MHIWRTLKGVKPSIRLAASLIVRTRFLDKISAPFLFLLNKMLTQMKVLYVAHSVRLAVRRPLGAASACRTLDEHYAASCCTMLACVNKLL